MMEIRARRVFILLEDKPDTQVSESQAEGLKKNAGEWDVDNLYHYSYWIMTIASLRPQE